MWAGGHAYASVGLDRTLGPAVQDRHSRPGTAQVLTHVPLLLRRVRIYTCRTINGALLPTEQQLIMPPDATE